MTSAFVFLSVHDIFSILLRYHISTAFSRLSESLFIVQLSHPYKRTGHTYYYAFRVEILVWLVTFLFVNMGLILLNVSSDMAILLIISMSFFTTYGMVHPRYLNLFTWVNFTSACVLLQDCMLVLFEITMHSVFFVLSSSPFSAFVSATVVKRFWSLCSESPMETVHFLIGVT